jgi:hypothetical protein
MNKAAEDFESIARRLKELEAEKQEALTGSSAPILPERSGMAELVQESYESLYGYGGGIDHLALKQYQQALADSSAWASAPVNMKSSAHPGWPYAGSPHEWRGFITQK